VAHHDIHVIPHGAQWAIIREGDGALVSVHESRSNAEQAGRQLATDGDVEFLLHTRDERAESDDVSDGA
jgi:hypothetical protein